MWTRESFTILIVFLVASLSLPVLVHGQVDKGVIRLGRPQAQQSEGQSERVRLGTDRFDHETFERRLESYWFRRKALLAEGRTEDAHRQSELIKSFIAEEGVVRLGALAGALVVEANRYLQEGSYEKALAALDLAEAFDAGRSQVYIGRASVLWHSGGAYVEAMGEYLKGIRASLVQAWSDFSLVNHLAVALVIALLGTQFLFSVLMAFKYHVPLRHQVEEWITGVGARRWARSTGWVVLLLPLLTWMLAGWIAMYWIILTFRFMRRSERVAALLLLLAMALTVPAFRISVALYGMMTDPAVRTTLESASHDYSPDRIVELKELVEAQPDDAAYNFLLAGLYKDGRYFEEAYHQYRRVIELDPSNYRAHVNLGNIYYQLSQYAEAVVEYHNAIEIRPDSALAFYNMYLAQSESFKFKEAEESLKAAQRIDSELASELLSRGQGNEEHATVVDAGIHMGSVWRAALEGRPLRQTLEQEGPGGIWQPLPRHFLNVLSLVALLSVGACGAMVYFSRGAPPARRCIRCGHPFCQRCRSGKEGMEYCSQCLHLFVIGDGLAPEAKTKKNYEVERFERFTRRSKKIFSLLLPGATHLLLGRVGRGFAMVFLWVTAILVWKPEVLTPTGRLLGVDPHLDLLRPSGVPALFLLEPSAVLALITALTIWISGNLWLWRKREV